ncbi:MAG: rhodanese-like domain-containing protein [Acidimicrobiales bacterium]
MTQTVTGKELWEDACANSKLAASRLRSLGYVDVRAYEGGKQEWIEAGLPVESTSDRQAV